MRFVTVILFLFSIGFCAVAKAQEKSAAEGLLAEGYELVAENPEQARKIGEHLLKNASANPAISDANFLIADSYFTSGAYNQALTFAFRAKQSAEISRSKTRTVPICVFIANLLRILQLEKQSSQYLETAKMLARSDKNTDLVHWANGASLIQSALGLESRNPEKALAVLEQAKIQLHLLPKKSNSALLNHVAVIKAAAFTSLGKNDSADYYFQKSAAYYHENRRDLLGKAIFLKEFLRLRFQQQQYQKATNALLESAAIAEKLQHAELLRDLNKQLAVSYLALNDRNNYHTYNQKFLALSSKIEDRESEATNTAFNLISQEQESRMAAEDQKFQHIFLAAVACFLLVVVFGSIQLFRNKARQRRYSEILHYLKSGRNPIILTAIPEKKGQDVSEQIKQVSKNNLFIPAETEQNILSKLKKFEASVKFTNKEMSLAMLAAQLDTNTKYLSEIINKHYHDNFNTYINKLRINYIMEKLKSEPAYLNYKISYLAEESGFSSHSSFATIFKSITGIAPTTFIDFLKEETAGKPIEN